MILIRDGTELVSCTVAPKAGAACTSRATQATSSPDSIWGDAHVIRASVAGGTITGVVTSPPGVIAVSRGTPNLFTALTAESVSAVVLLAVTLTVAAIPLGITDVPPLILQT